MARTRIFKNFVPGYFLAKPADKGDCGGDMVKPRVESEF